MREPRSQRDEPTAVKGSTRLEAKKQRRREGREAGRRRTIITEAEFLARRESVERVMVVRGRGDRTQIGVLEDGVLVEHYVSRESTASMAGNVYLGRVQNVLPSMEAAFVDIGKGTISTAPGYTVSGLNLGTTYYFRVIAHNTLGQSAPSNVTSATTPPPTVPSAPTNCDAYQLGGNGSDTLRIDWDPPINNGGAPILFYDIAVGAVLKTSVWSPNTTYDATLPVGTGGWVVIVPYNKAGIGPSCAVPVYMHP